MTQIYTHVPDLLAELPEIPDDSIVSRTFYRDGQIKVILFGFAAGQELSEHTASVAAMLHIVQGEAKLTVAGDAFAAGPGTWVHMTPRQSHSIVAETPVVMLLYMLQDEDPSHR
jgi:quercetin dioxygenase-like cupin family protein